MEELDLRVSDIKKDAFDFKRVIATQAVDPRTGKILAEKLLRFYEEKGREKVGATLCNSLGRHSSRQRFSRHSHNRRQSLRRRA